jgi:hypothetical protein
MPFNSPDINTFKADLDHSIAAILKLNANSHATLKIQSLLNVTVYVLGTRFVEGCVKHIIYNCARMRGDTPAQLTALESELKKFNNPEYTLIKNAILTHLNFDINAGLVAGRYTTVDISFLNEIVKNRHRNVHATYDAAEWYNQNIRSITDFQQQYAGLIRLIEYLDCIIYDNGRACFVD